MLPFKRSYLTSAAILSVFVTLSVIGSIGSGNFSPGVAIILLAVAAAAIFPIFWRGGILANPRLAISMAAIFAIATGSMVGLAFLDFVRTGGSEGPRGEGSPMASMIALAFGAAVGFCPWLLTTLRGMPHWNTRHPG